MSLLRGIALLFLARVSAEACLPHVALVFVGPCFACGSTSCPRIPRDTDDLGRLLSPVTRSEARTREPRTGVDCAIPSIGLLTLSQAGLSSLAAFGARHVDHLRRTVGAEASPPAAGSAFETPPRLLGPNVRVSPSVGCSGNDTAPGVLQEPTGARRPGPAFLVFRARWADLASVLGAELALLSTP